MAFTKRQSVYLNNLRAGIEDRPSETVFQRWMHDPEFVAARDRLLSDSIKLVAPTGIMSIAADHLLAAAGAAADDADGTRVASHLNVYYACLAWPDRSGADAANGAESAGRGVVRGGRFASG